MQRACKRALVLPDLVWYGQILIKAIPGGVRSQLKWRFLAVGFSVLGPLCSTAGKIGWFSCPPRAPPPQLDLADKSDGSVASYASLGSPMGCGGKGSTGSDPAGDNRGYRGGRQHGRAAGAADSQPPTTGTSTRHVSQSNSLRQCGRSRPTPLGWGSGRRKSN